MKTSAIAILAALALTGASVQTASARDREWATAGKVLTGVIAGSILLRAFEPPPVYTVPATPVYVTPPPVAVQPAPVVVYQQPIVYQQAPVVYQQTVAYATPVVVQPAPVYVTPVPVVVAPRPRVYVHFGFGHAYCPPPIYYRVCR